MRITINNEATDEFLSLDVSSDMSLEDLVALLQLDCGFDSGKHELWFANQVLNPTDTRTLEQLGLVNDELIVIKVKSNSLPAANIPEDAMVEQFRQQVVQNPAVRSQLTSANPGFASVIDDPVAFRETVGPYLLQNMNAHGAQQNPFGIPQRDYEQLMQNPDDPANQKRISELISQQEIDEQMRNAYEFTPEVFTPVHMLYINLEINGTPIKAFVDSGAQTTIMSTKLAKKTDLFRLIDKRFQGEAHGVGIQKILGKIHVAQVKIETQHIPCSFTVIDTHVDMLLGLDMLKRHQACIDLKDNVLKIAGVETKFLSEAELPKDFDAETLQATAASRSNPQAPSQTSNQNTKGPVTAITPATAPKISEREFPDSTILQLMDLGFSKPEVIRALESAKGNADVAAALLFQ
ncbi:LANO_0F03862g1_1 [Lachancea nothofagi CBS 11611]|uniref:DNA damage-inducible protein 1 n=1 Tax=Lachancea nothofagi CBS 11611 TaxID=1266666 RepID=A0A1G4K7B3_9SACH|nr:LANO_0F03862g1_1 [Lachancea nothofagi CBS 11611]